MLLTSAYPQGIPAAMFEFMSDNTEDNGVVYNYRYDWVQEAYRYETISLTSYDTPHGVWERYYKAAITANTALVACDELEAQGHDMSAHRAEARMTRAWAHFLLVNTFCQAYNTQSSETDLGIPYITEPITNVFAHFERGTVKEVWDKINEDIEAALPDIDDGLYEIPKNHFNRKAAYCFAAEFNLFYGNYDKAIEYAQVVLGLKPQNQMRDMEALNKAGTASLIRNGYIDYKADCNLMIMSVYSQWGRSHTNGSYARYAQNRRICYGATHRSPGPWSGKDSQGRYNATYLSYYNNYSKDDILAYYPKMTEIFETTDPTLNTGYTHVVWVPFTVEKALLARAEAYLMKGMIDAAADDLILWYKSKTSNDISLSPDEIIEYYRGYIIVGNEEEVYTGAEYGLQKFDLNPRFELSEGDQTYMALAILHARRIEFVHEGWRWLDLKRYGISVTHNQDRQADLILEPWDKRFAIQLPLMVLAAGMEPNPRDN